MKLSENSYIIIIERKNNKKKIYRGGSKCENKRE